MLTEESRSNRYLSLLVRQRIASLRGQNLGVRAIAARLGRSPSTISRELNRNTLAHDRGVYDGDLAHARARQRTHLPRHGRLISDQQLRRSAGQAGAGVEPGADRCAPAPTYPDRPAWHLCHETIYQPLYHGGRGGLNRQLTRGCEPAGRYASAADDPINAAAGSSHLAY